MANARAWLLAVAALVVVLPVASWIYLRGARPALSSATTSLDASKPAAPPEAATLYRGESQFAGTVSWRREPALASGGRESGFRVDAAFEPIDQYPDGLRLGLSIAANPDPDTVPAAQIAEIRFTTGAGQPAEVRSAPGILIRATESESGQPLLGITAKSTVPGLYFVATSPADRDVDANAALLRAGGWIDIPFIDTNGTPAVVGVAVGRNQPLIWSALKAWSESAR